ncbi:MAG: hypothetical protein JXQ68_05785 [Campylobacterales bacterium]|nr:hypothetical protein [Campylobacterales bacterium]
MIKKIFLFIALLFSTALFAQSQPIRVAVIGGITMSGLWDQISTAFEKKYGIKTELVITGPKRILGPYCKNHDVDLVTMHSSDTIANLAAEGIIEELTPWMHNSQMLIAPKTNPAKLEQGDTLQSALQKITDSKSNFLIHASGGTFEIFHAISMQYAFQPKIIFTQKTNGFLEQVVTNDAYTLFGVIPFLMKKHSNANVQGFIFEDETLRRPYLAGIGTIKQIGKERHKNAKLLQQYLISPEVQRLIQDFRLKDFSDTLVFFPIKEK